MEDLEKQFFANKDNLESQFFAEKPKQEEKRGANFAGAARNVAQQVPFLGTWADEVEGIRSLWKPGDYETWRRNAEESALGNIKNTSYGKGLEVGSNIAMNAIKDALTRGVTLLPPISALQGGIEGFGRGNTLGSRLSNATVEAGIGWVAPRVFNKLLPTKSVQAAEIEKYAKRPLETLKDDSSIGKTILAKALKENRTPEDIIANEVSKGYRPTLWKNLARAFRNEDSVRSVVLKSAAEAQRPLYAEYIEKEIQKVAPQYANKIGNQIKKLKLDELGSDTIQNMDIREIAKEAVNTVMRKAPSADKNLVKDTMENAIAKKSVAEKMTSVATPNPENLRATMASGLSALFAIPTNISNAGWLRLITAGTPKYKGKFNFYTPNWLRGAVDSLIEGSTRESIK